MNDISARRRRLLVVTRSIPLHPGSGGMERIAWDVICGLTRDWDVEVLTTGLAGRPPTFTHDGVVVRCLPGARPGRYSMRWWLGTGRGKNVPAADVIFSVSASASAITWLQPSARVVFQVHGSAFENMTSTFRMRDRLWPLKVIRSACWVLIDTLTYRRADAVVAASERVETALRQRPYRACWNRTLLRVIPNGVDIQAFRPNPSARESTRAAYGYNQDDLVAITVSRLDHQKGVDRFLKALDELPNHKFLVVGAGPEEAALRELAELRGLAARVTFAGLIGRPELPALLAAADVFVFPVRGAEREGLPLAVLEALASGLAVLAPEDSTWAADLEPLLVRVPMDDVARIAQGIDEINAASGRRRSRLPARYDLEKCRRSYLELLDSLVLGGSK